jgi:hypothetical protein
MTLGASPWWSADPRGLAALRIVLCCVVLVAAPVAGAPEAAADALPPSAALPASLRALYAAGLVDPTLAGWAAGIVRVAAFAALIGVWTRRALVVVAVGLLYVLGLGQLGGAPVHTHHLVWFAGALALSRCGDVWALTAPKVTPAAGSAYGVPTHACAALLACVYFFPGVHKVIAGDGWLHAGALQHLAWWKWAQSWDHEPPAMFLDHPWLLVAAGAAVLTFELAAPVVVVAPRARWVFALLMVGFHLGTAWVVDIRFSTLWPLAVVLLPFYVWPRAGAGPSPPARAPESVLLGTLVLAVGFAGASGSRSGWPFACYPTFAEPVPEEMPALQVVVVAAGVARVLPREAWMDPEPADWARTWRLAGVGGPFDRAALDAWWERARARPDVAAALVGAEEVRFERVFVHTDPALRGAPPARAVPLYQRAP